MSMFNPNAQAAKKAEKAAKKKALAELKAYTESVIPQELHDGTGSLALPTLAPVYGAGGLLNKH
jgi:hypothetical protein